jgi:hypothetical protein
MIGRAGSVLDFGLAKRTYGLGNLPASTDGTQAAGWATALPGQGASMSGPVAGTPGYMSPEQVLAGTQDARTDVFAFGCVLYECLTGRRAFPADDAFVAMAQVLNESPDMALLPPRTPQPVRDMVEACLAKDAEARPGSMRDLRRVSEALGIRRAAALARAAHRHAATCRRRRPRSWAARPRLSASPRSPERLLTLTGLGGSGKTRLAIELATDSETFRDGVWFVDVAPLTEPERLIEALAGVLGLRDEPGLSLLRRHRRPVGTRHALLFDNAETHAAAARRSPAHCCAAVRSSGGGHEPRAARRRARPSMQCPPRAARPSGAPAAEAATAGRAAVR